MARKNISTTTDPTPSVDLGEGEQLVIENKNTKTIRKERQPTPEPEPAEAETESVDGELLDDETDEVAPEDSIAAFLDREDSDDLSEAYCSVIVRREPDSINDRFAVPCTEQSVVGTFRGVAIATSKADLALKVQSQFGGGHYTLQFRLDGRLSRSWRVTVLDMPGQAAAAAAKATGEIAAAAAPAPVATGNPIDDFISQLERQERLRSALFGADQKRYEQQIEELRTELRDSKDNFEPKSERMQLLEKALTIGEGDVQSRILQRVFPSDDGSKSATAEVFELVLEHSDKILPVVGGLIQMLFGGGGVAAPTNAAPTNGGAVGHPAPPTDPMAAFRAPAPVAVPPPVRESKMRQNMNAGASAEIDTTAEEDEVLDGTSAETIDPHPRTLEPVAE